MPSKETIHSTERHRKYRQMAKASRVVIPAALGGCDAQTACWSSHKRQIR